MTTFVKPHQWWIFYFCKAEVRLYRMKSDSLRLNTIWQRDDSESFLAFQVFTQILRNQAVMVLLESEDQVLQQEKIPYLIGYDRYGLIDRKLAAIGQGAEKTLAYFISQGRMKTDGQEKQEALILAAAMDSHDYLPWLITLRHVGARLAAVTTTSLVTASAAKAAGNTSGLIIHATWNRGGLVQTVLDKGFPILARFCPWTSDTWSKAAGWSEDVAKNITVTQTEKLLSYLQGRGLWSPTLKVRLTVVLPFALNISNKDWPTIAGIDWQTVTAPEQQIAALGSLPVPDINSWQGAESLQLSQMVSLPNIYQLAPRSMRLRYLHWVVMRYSMRAVWLVGAIMIVLAIVYGSMWGFRALENADINNNYQNTQERYKKMRSSFPDTGVSNQDLRDVFAITAAIEQCHPGLPDLILKISKANNAHPNIELTGFNWQQNISEGESYANEAPALTCTQKYELSGTVNARVGQGQRGIQGLFDNWLQTIKQLSEKHKIRVNIKTPPLDLTQGKYVDNIQAPTKSYFSVELLLITDINLDK